MIPSSSRSTLILAIFVISLAACTHAFYWTELSPSSTFKPPSRSHAGLEWTPSALYVFGGKATTGALSDTWFFSFYSNTWTGLSLLDKPSARYGFLSGRVGDYWYITHGRSDGGNVFSDTWAFHFDDKEWYQVDTTGDLPAARYFAAGGSNPAGALSSFGILWMSMGTDRVGRKLSDTWTLTINASSPLEGVWKRVSEGVGLNQYNPSLPHARSEASGLALGYEHFILSGGCASGGQVGGPCPLEDSWLYHSLDDSWSRLSSCNPPTHSSSFVPLNIQSPDIGLLYGGSQTGPGTVSQAISGTTLNSDELSIINITSLQWTRVRISNNSLPLLRSGTQMTPGAAGVYMFGGMDKDGNLLNDIWLLERTSDSVTVLSCSTRWFSFLHLHGILMYIAWGLLLPFGALIGRYYQWSIRPVWFTLHIVCQVGGLLVTLAGFVIILLVSTTPSFPHAVIGIVLLFAIIQQFLTGVIRPWSMKKAESSFVNKDSIKYKWKQCWKVYHQVSGLVAISIGFVQVTLGVFLINGPQAVWIVWCVLLLLWLLAFVFHEIVHCFRNRFSKD